jgi:hypothetical protein
MAETYTLNSGDAGVIFSKDCTEVRLLIEKRDTLEEAELLAIGVSVLANNAEWRRKVCLRAKEILDGPQQDEGNPRSE